MAVLSTMAALSRPLAKPVAEWPFYQPEAQMTRSLDLEQDGNFYHFPCKEFINGRAVRIIEISRRKKRKPG